MEGGPSNIGLSGGSDIIHDATALLHKASRDLEGNVRERIIVEEALCETKLLIKSLEKKKELFLSVEELIFVGLRIDFCRSKIMT